MTPQTLFVAQGALRKDMADQMECRATPSRAYRPGHGEQAALRAVLHQRPAWLPGRMRTTLAKPSALDDLPG